MGNSAISEMKVGDHVEFQFYGKQTIGQISEIKAQALVQTTSLLVFTKYNTRQPTPALPKRIAKSVVLH